MTFRTSSFTYGLSRPSSVAHAVAASALSACAITCQSPSEQPPPASTPSTAERNGGFDLVYRKPSSEPFTSAEVEQIAEVLRKRLHAVEASMGLSATAEAGNLLCVALPDAPNAGVVETLRPSFEVVGELSFEAVASDATPGWDERAERERLRAWWETQAEPDVARYTELTRDAGGPPEFIRWREQRSTEVEPSGEERLRSLLPCVKADVLHPNRGWAFGAKDLARVFGSTDYGGWPAIGFELREDRCEAFGDFSEAYVDHQVAIVIDGCVVSAPLVLERLGGASIIQGRFEGPEVDAWILAFQAGALPTELELVEVRPRAER